jgi:putative inorganic carbon (hco3(-)) transporter
MNMEPAITINLAPRYGGNVAHRRPPRPMPAKPTLHVQTPSRHRLGFGLFILVNAVLFVRPAEIVPGLENWPIYQFLIIVCLLFSLRAVLPQLTWTSLKRNPITLCVIGLLPAIFLSHISHGDLWSARMGSADFLKIVVYYLLLVGLIDSPARLRIFLLVIAGFILCTAVLCLLNHHGIIEITALSDLSEAYGEDADTGETNFIKRLRAMGIFGDPNDFCLILNAAIFITLHSLITQKNWLFKFAWTIPVGILVYAVTLTQSRGGFLSLLAGLTVLLFTRIRPKPAFLITACLLPAMLIAIGGRLANINVQNKSDTAQGRIQLWRDSMVEFHKKPLFGIGQGNLADTIGWVAHNSFVHSYAELGFFGGTLFVNAFYLALANLRTLRVGKVKALSPELRSVRLCLFPVLAAYITGIYSLSKCYGNATYLILGVVAAFLSLCATSGVRMRSLSFRMVGGLVMISVACLFFFEVFVRVFAA